MAIVTRSNYIEDTRTRACPLCLQVTHHRHKSQQWSGGSNEKLISDALAAECKRSAVGSQISVEYFHSSEEQGVCAEVESDVSPIRLTLLIEEVDNTLVTRYADAQEFSNGPVYFYISPKLPSGKYTARIMYARRTLATIDFEVLEK